MLLVLHRYWNVENSESLVYHMYNNSWKVDHFKVASAKKQERERKEQQMTMRVLYPILIMLSAGCGVLGAVYGVLWWVSNRPGSTLGARKKRRLLHSIAVTGGSPQGTAKSSPRGGGKGSPQGSSTVAGNITAGSSSGSSSRSSTRLHQQNMNMHVRRLS